MKRNTLVTLAALALVVACGDGPTNPEVGGSSAFQAPQLHHQGSITASTFTVTPNLTTGTAFVAWGATSNQSQVDAFRVELWLAGGASAAKTYVLAATARSYTIPAADLSAGEEYVVRVTGSATHSSGPNGAAQNATYYWTAFSSPFCASGCKEEQTVTFDDLPSRVYGDNFTVGASVDSHLALAFAAGGSCTVGSVTFDATTSRSTAPVQLTGVGPCTITASNAGDAAWSEVTAGQSFAITPASLTVTAEAKSKTFDGVAYPSAAFTVAYGGFVNGETESTAGIFGSSSLTYTTWLAGDASKTPVSPVNAGTYTIHPSGLTAANYTITFEDGTLTIDKASQTITFTSAPPSAAAYNTTFDVAATASSGLGVAISVSGDACSLAAGTVTITKGTGTCTVTATQAGNGNYELASEVRPVTVEKANQAALTITGPATATYGDHVTPTVSGGSSAGALTFAVVGGSACAIDGDGKVQITSGVGTCSVAATMAGDDNYNSVTSAPFGITPEKASQTVSFNPVPPASAVYNTTVPVAAVASSGLTTAISVAPAAVCSWNASSGLVTMTKGTGTCTVTAAQPGNDNYRPATSVTHDIEALKADQTVAFNPALPASAIYNTTFAAAAIASSGLTPTVSVSGVCTRDAGTSLVTMTSGTGSCTVTAAQAGDDNYNAAPSVQDVVAAVKADQTIAFTSAPPASAVYNTTFPVAASASSGLAITISVGGVCSIASGVDTMTSGTGSCIVTAAQPGDANYNDAQEQATVAALQAAQTISFAVLTDVIFEVGGTRSLSASTTSGLTVSFSSTTPTFCAVSGTTVSYVKAGTCTIEANQAGDANYLPATPVVRSFLIAPWTLSGFYQPVDMSGGALVWNTVKGGSTVPLKFEVFSGNTERTDVGAIKSFTQTRVTCVNAPLVDEIEIVTTGGTSLRYDGTAGQYIQNWQTPKQPGACYRATATMQDGSPIVAYFLLK